MFTNTSLVFGFVATICASPDSPTGRVYESCDSAKTCVLDKATGTWGSGSLQSLLKHPQIQEGKVRQLCTQKEFSKENSICDFSTDEEIEHFWLGKPCYKSDKCKLDCYHALNQCDIVIV